MVDLISPVQSAAPVSGLGAISTSGASLIPAAVGRGVDAITGRRSRVARFVRNQNRGQNEVKGDANLPSLRAGCISSTTSRTATKLQGWCKEQSGQLAQIFEQAANRKGRPK